MSQAVFLKRFPALRTQSPDELQQWLSPAYAIRGLSISKAGRRFDSTVNHRELDSIALTYASYGSSFSARLQHNDFFVQGFPISGSGEVRCNGQSAIVNTTVGGTVGGPRSDATVSYDDSFSHLILKLSPAALTRKLSAMIGKPIDPGLRLVDGPSSNPAYFAGQARLIRYLAEELDETDGPLSPVALAEIEQAIIVAYLTASHHNYSHWLNGPAHTVAPWQVRCAADYIEQNWDQPITIEALSHITQISTRSLFHLFKRTYGVSPMVFVRQIRLRHARSMLSHPAPDTNVTAVGFLCGFSNLGHFAKSYFEAFGERPSETLRARR